tara:strand:+ start:40022 stop:40183 length:162 start_codon:yes stop_codon:yes gene_type:complete
LFTKNITRGKFEVLNSLKSKVIKESYNYKQRERKREKRIEDLTEKESEQALFV